MSESVNRLKANKLIAGARCGWCSNSIEFGQDVAVCASCESPQHAGCWDKSGGCATAECVNAPLKQLDVPEVAVAPQGMKFCPHCNEVISRTDEICVHCNKAATADGVYRGPKQNAPGAVASMVWGIIGFFFCGLILGLVAINNSNKAKKAITADPRLSGSGFATAGMVLGIIDIVFWGLWLILRFAARSM